MSFDLPNSEQNNPLHSLLLTMQQEVEARKDGIDEYGTNPYFEKQFQQEDRRIALLGTKHTDKLSDIEKDVAFYRQTNPDILLHEGNDIRTVFYDVFPGMTDDEIRELDPAVVAKNQEQIFLAWQAWKDGKVVQSWDISFKSQIEIIAKNHSPEAIAGFLVSIALGKLYGAETPISPSKAAIEELLPRVLSKDDMDDLAKIGIDLSFSSLESAAQKYLKTSFAKLAERFGDEVLRREDAGLFHRYFDPVYPGETNAVLCDMNVVRDQHAIDVIEKAKDRYGNILVVAGGSHVRTWKPAVAELYRNNDSSMNGKAVVDGVDGVILRKRREGQLQKRKKNIADARQIAQGLKDT